MAHMHRFGGLHCVGGFRSVWWCALIDTLLKLFHLDAENQTQQIRISQSVSDAVKNAGGVQDAKEESGWKLISGDVFRAPPAAADLAVQVRPSCCRILL